MDSWIQRCRQPGRVAQAAVTLGTLAALDLALAPGLAAAASFSPAPDVPNLPALTLNGAAQSPHATMANFGVALGIGETAGFNITVNGDGSAGHSAVFKAYCTGPTACGPDASAAYVSAGATLAADSLTLNSTGATWTTGLSLGATPAMLCNSGCLLDHSAATRVATEASTVLSVLGGTWTAGNWGTTSIVLAAPSTVRVLPAGEAYRVDLLWTLSSGP